jgi:SAM-dependent methyltransferase
MKETLLEHLAGHGSPARAVITKMWRLYTMRHLRQSDNYKDLNRLYAVPDPWAMVTGREQSRFQQTNAVLESLVGPVESILEIGSGEGHQSEHLSRLCQRLDGVDVSARAVARACERVPHCRFGVGDIANLPWTNAAEKRYDLVVACEMLYYVADVPKTIARMSDLGRACLVTFFCPAARILARHVEAIPGAQRGWMYHDPYAWLWAFWRP